MSQFANDQTIFEALEDHAAFSEATGPDALDGSYENRRANFHQTFWPLIKSARELQAKGIDAVKTYELIGRLLTQQTIKGGEAMCIDEGDRVVEIDERLFVFEPRYCGDFDEAVKQVVNGN